MTARCLIARERQRLAKNGNGFRLAYIKGSWECGLALKTCDGLTDPGCGYFAPVAERAKT